MTMKRFGSRTFETKPGWIAGGLLLSTLLALSVAGALPAAAASAHGSSGTWTLQQPPNVNGTAQLEAVSCPAKHACEGVGIGNGGKRPFAASWNGSGWTTQRMAKVGGTHPIAEGVSCTTTTNCLAVGSYSVGSNGVEAFAEQWNGTAWTLLTLPSPQGDILTSVACVSASSCMAVGNDGTSDVVALLWNGSSWASETVPTPAGSFLSFLRSVSCVAVPSPSCIAVGGYVTGSESSEDASTLADAWDGTSWTLQAPQNPSGYSNNQLTGVSCISSTSCTAVGEATNLGPGQPGTYVTVAEAWNGTGWALQTIPDDAGNNGTTTDNLDAVDCTSASFCIAVGSYSGQNARHPMAELWNGEAWSFQNPPAGSAYAVQTDGQSVSCWSSTACLTGGWYQATERSSFESYAAEYRA
jgi:hypothetical protein